MSRKAYDQPGLDPAVRRRLVLKAFGTDAGAYQAPLLDRLANGPILDPNRLYLPCGRISEAAARAREAAAILEAHPA